MRTLQLKIPNSKFEIRNFDTRKGGIFLTLQFQHNYATYVNETPNRI